MYFIVLSLSACKKLLQQALCFFTN